MGQNGRDSQCIICKRKERAKRQKKNRKKGYTVIDGKDLIVEVVTVGEPSKEAMKNVARIIAQSYLNRGGCEYV